ncbi:hypothetical protein ACVWZP_001501 [Pseudomonas sp. TE36184]
MFEVLQALQVFQAFDQAFFFLSRQVEDAQVGAWGLQQLFAVTDTGAGRGRVGECS